MFKQHLNPRAEPLPSGLTRPRVRAPTLSFPASCQVTRFGGQEYQPRQTTPISHSCSDLTFLSPLGAAITRSYSLGALETTDTFPSWWGVAGGGWKSQVRRPWGCRAVRIVSRSETVGQPLPASSVVRGLGGLSVVSCRRAPTPLMKAPPSQRPCLLPHHPGGWDFHMEFGGMQTFRPEQPLLSHYP